MNRWVGKRKNDFADAVRITGEQIALHLRSLSLDPAKRDKVLLAAQKLGIDLEDSERPALQKNN